MYSSKLPPEADLLYEYFKEHAQEGFVSLSFDRIRQDVPMRLNRLIIAVKVLEDRKIIKVDRKPLKKHRKACRYKFIEKIEPPEEGACEIENISNA